MKNVDEIRKECEAIIESNDFHGNDKDEVIGESVRRILSLLPPTEPTTWSCGRCDGMRVPMHTRRCPKRGQEDQEPEYLTHEPAQTTGSVEKRALNDRPSDVPLPGPAKIEVGLGALWSFVQDQIGRASFATDALVYGEHSQDRTTCVYHYITYRTNDLINRAESAHYALAIELGSQLHRAVAALRSMEPSPVEDAGASKATVYIKAMRTHGYEIAGDDEQGHLLALLMGGADLIESVAKESADLKAEVEGREREARKWKMLYSYSRMTKAKQTAFWNALTEPDFENMTDEEVDAELREMGIDPDELTAKTNEMIARLKAAQGTGDGP